MSFDFTDLQGRAVLTIKHQPRTTRQYDLTVTDDHLDWRLAAACAVAVDTRTMFWLAGAKIATT